MRLENALSAGGELEGYFTLADFAEDASDASLASLVERKVAWIRPEHEGVQLRVLLAEARQFRDRFKQANDAMMTTMLDMSEQTAIAEVGSYGIEWTSEFIDVIDQATIGDTIEQLYAEAGKGGRVVFDVATNARTRDSGAATDDKRTGLQEAARRLGAEQARVHQVVVNKNHVDKAIGKTTPKLASITSALGAIELPTLLPTIELADDLDGLRDQSAVLGEEIALFEAKWTLVEAEYPILAAFRSADGERLRALGEEDEPHALTEALATQIVAKLFAINKARQGLAEDKYDSLEMSPVVRMTKAQLGVVPGSMRDRFVTHDVDEASEMTWRDIAGLAIGIGLAVLAIAAAPATGGTSLTVVAAELGGLTLDVWLAYQALEQYEYDQAAADTDFNSERSLGTGPSALGLAMDLAGAGLSGLSAVKVLGDYAQALRASSNLAPAELETLRLQLNEAGKMEGVAGLGDQLLAKYAKNVGRSTDALDELAEVTDEMLPTLSKRMGADVVGGGTGNSVRLVTDVDGAGDVVITGIRVGPNTKVGDILAHREAMKRLTRYNGKLGEVRRVWDRIGVVFGKDTVNPFPGGLPFEAFEEMQKLPGLVQQRLAQLGLSGADADRVLIEEIARLEAKRVEYGGIVDDALETGRVEPGRGWVAMDDVSDPWADVDARGIAGSDVELPDANALRNSSMGPPTGSFDISMIPRQELQNDLYTPFRDIADGSDVRRIAELTGTPEADVLRAKQHLMFDEHIIADGDTVVLGRFEPLDELVTQWGRFARGGDVTPDDVDWMRQLVRHEHAEGTFLRQNSRLLREAMEAGELEGMLRGFLRRHGETEEMIEIMMEAESKPLTPFRFSHYVVHYSGHVNPR